MRDVLPPSQCVKNSDLLQHLDAGCTSVYDALDLHSLNASRIALACGSEEPQYFRDDARHIRLGPISPGT
jgi:hypothetical protein